MGLDKAGNKQGKSHAANETTDNNRFLNWRQAENERKDGWIEKKRKGGRRKKRAREGEKKVRGKLMNAPSFIVQTRYRMNPSLAAPWAEKQQKHTSRPQGRRSNETTTKRCLFVLTREGGQEAT